MLGGSYANAIPSPRGNSTTKVHCVKEFLKFAQKNKNTNYDYQLSILAQHGVVELLKRSMRNNEKLSLLFMLLCMYNVFLMTSRNVIEVLQKIIKFLSNK